MTLDQIEPGMLVIYVPNHAYGERQHPDCERGVVSSKNDKYAFVRYGRSITGIATDPADLVPLAQRIVQ